MADINLCIVTTLTLLAYAFGIPNSKYLKTQVLLENISCLSRYEGARFLTKERQTKISCSSLCTATKGCRRFMYNKESKQCSLFTNGENCYVDESEITEPYVCYRQRFVCEKMKCSRCPIGFYGDWCEKTIKDCIEGTTLGGIPSARMLSYIQPSSSSPPFETVCRFKYGATMISTRDINCFPINFNRSWNDYENGFGNLNGDFWIGLRRIRDILQTYSRFLLIIKVKFATKQEKSFYYEIMRLTNNSDSYRIYLNASADHPNNPVEEALIGPYNINGTKFSTYDRDATSHNCPARFKGGWWFVDDTICSEANANGRKILADAEDNWGWKYDNMMLNDVVDIRIRLQRI